MAQPRNPLTQPSVYLNFCDSLTVESNANGSARAIVVTPKRFWGLGLNLADFMGCLRIGSPSANAGVTLKWQFSIDGAVWKTSNTAVITEKTVADDFIGIFNSGNEIPPFVRAVVEIRDTVANVQVTAVVSVWGNYRFRS